MPDVLTQIRLNNLVRAPRKRVFAALTTAEEFPHWFAPGPNEKCVNVVIEPHVGGTFRFEMNDAKGDTQVGAGQFTEVIQDRKISYTWTWETMPDFGGNSLVTFELFDAENPYDKDQPATEIVLTHEKLNTAAERSEHTGGWWQCLRALGYHVRGLDAHHEMFGKPATT